MPAKISVSWLTSMKRVGYIDFIRIFEENLNTCIYGRFSNSYLSGNNLSGTLSDEKTGAEKDRSEKVVRKTVPADAFPKAEEAVEEVRMTPPPTRRKKRAEHSAKQVKQPPKENKQTPVQVEKPEEDRSEYAFRTPSDARRAFIYSEIFRRKYD